MSTENEKHSGMIRENKEKEKDQSQEIRDLKRLLRKKAKEIKILKKEEEELKDKYLRIAAEIENLRKRLEREKKEYHKYALTEFLKELLNVLDNIERALESKNQMDDKSLEEGMRLIYKQFLEVLRKNGVKPIEIMDKKFDPNLHDALMTTTSDNVDEPEVSEELQKGYSLHDRLLRPALVKVVVPRKNN